MCGRFNVTSDPLNQLIVEITGRGFVIETKYNLAPTEQVPVLFKHSDGEWDVHEMRWWLVPYWADAPSNKYSMFNAKSETLHKSRAFREPFKRRRCIVPATGYYEWRTENGRKLPLYITPEDGNGFAFAGLWDRWKGPEQTIESCTVVTTAASNSMSRIHNRMPVCLSVSEAQTWMDPDADETTLKQLFAPIIRMPIAVTPVSTFVNNARNKDERCVEPLGESEHLAVGS
ncbi:MAG TPA: SOS response-associated peptidase [Pseudomonadales bacterium]|nr:SOS response-associated peptidase [Pseudomonadales bacterium]